MLGSYYKFPQGSIPSDLSERWDRSILVPDNGLDMIHIFSGYYNEYLCSYNGSANQNQSMFTNLGRIPTMYNYSATHISNNIIAIDSWGTQTGFNRFYTGVDVFDLSDYYFQHSFSNEPFTFSLSARSRCTFEVIRNRDNYTMLLDENVDRSAGEEQIYHIDFGGYDAGSYKIIISAIPYNNSDYGSYAVQPVSKEYIVHYGNVLSGNVVLENSLTIDSGETLTIEAGANITFQNGSSLIVNGTLNVNGTSNNKVTFDFISQNSTTQNGIRINNNGLATINHAIIKNANKGIYVNGDLTLKDSDIFNCRYGLYQYSSDVTYVKNSNFNNNFGGAYLYNSDGRFLENKFENNAYNGVECITNSSPNFGDGYNEFYNNDVGFVVESSFPTLGIVEGCIDFGGYNSFNGNGDEMEVTGNSTVYAQKNWWGYGTPYFHVQPSSNLYRIPELSSPPQQGQGAFKTTPEEDEFNKQFTPQLSSVNNSSEPLNIEKYDKLGYDENWSLGWKLLFVRNLIKIHRYNFAAEICENVINQFPDSSLSNYALHLFHKASEKGKDKDKLKRFVNSKSKLKVKKQLYGYAELLLTMEEKENRELELNNLKERYKDTELVEYILFDKFMYFLNDKIDIELAKLVSEELGKLFPGSRLHISSQRHLGNNVIVPLAPLLTKYAATEEITEKPKTYELHGNYPNPFNPSTTISYALPYNSNVELTIYNITGTVVKVFDESVQSAGYQNIVWNGDNQQGSRVSSGVYLYRFKAISLENGKTYEKTAKMLLIK